jgi:osmoprotectant transport system permease protein
MIIIDMFKLLFDRSEFFFDLLVEHFMLVIISVAIIGVVGLTLGILMTLNKKIANILLFITSFLYTIPSIAMFGILVAITGIGNKSAIVALVLYGLLPIIRNTYVGITEVNKDIIEAAKGMGTTKKQLLFKIQLPLASPVIFAGFRTMVIMTISLGGIASFIGAGGLGVAIYRGITTYNTEMIFAGSFLVAAFAIISDIILSQIEHRLKIKILGKPNGGNK